MNKDEIQKLLMSTRFIVQHTSHIYTFTDNTIGLDGKPISQYQLEQGDDGKWYLKSSLKNNDLLVFIRSLNSPLVIDLIERHVDKHFVTLIEE